jgi:hypothetical protein
VTAADPYCAPDADGHIACPHCREACAGVTVYPNGPNAAGSVCAPGPWVAAADRAAETSGGAAAPAATTPRRRVGPQDAGTTSEAHPCCQVATFLGPISCAPPADDPAWQAACAAPVVPNEPECEEERRQVAEQRASIDARLIAYNEAYLKGHAAGRAEALAAALRAVDGTALPHLAPYDASCARSDVRIAINDVHAKDGGR